MGWRQVGTEHHLETPKAASQVGVRLLRIEPAPSGYIAVIVGAFHGLEDRITDETRIELLSFDVDTAKHRAIGEIITLMTLAISALMEADNQ